MMYTVRVPDNTKMQAKNNLISSINNCISQVTAEKSEMQNILYMLDNLANGSVTGAHERLIGECQRGLQAAQSALSQLNSALYAARSLDTTMEMPVYYGQY